MAGFLRKKNKQEPPKTSQTSSAPPNPQSSVPPLFARFATTPNEPPASQRVVSSPMQLSSRRENAGANRISGGNTGHRDMESSNKRATTQQNQSYASSKARESMDSLALRNQKMPQNGQTRQSLGSERPDARPVSRVTNFDKPLPQTVPSNIADPYPQPHRQLSVSPIRSQNHGPLPSSQAQQQPHGRSRAPSVGEVRVFAPIQPEPVSQPRRALSNANSHHPMNVHANMSPGNQMGNNMSNVDRQHHQAPPSSFARQPPGADANRQSQNFWSHSQGQVVTHQDMQYNKMLETRTISRQPSALSNKGSFSHAGSGAQQGIGQYQDARGGSTHPRLIPRPQSSNTGIDLPSEVALFQEFSPPLPSPSNSLNSRNSMPRMKSIRQISSSSPERSSASPAKSAVERRTSYAQYPNQPVHHPQSPPKIFQEANNNMGINASFPQNHFSPLREIQGPRGPASSYPKSIPVPSNVMIEQPVVMNGNSGTQFSHPPHFSNVETRPSPVPTENFHQAHQNRFSTPTNGVNTLNGAVLPSKGKPLIFTTMATVGGEYDEPISQPVAPPTRAWDPEWDDPIEPEPEHGPTRSYPLTPPKTTTSQTLSTPRQELRSLHSDTQSVHTITNIVDNRPAPPSPTKVVILPLSQRQNPLTSVPTTTPSPVSSQQQSHSQPAPTQQVRQHKKLSKSKSGTQFNSDGSTTDLSGSGERSSQRNQSKSRPITPISPKKPVTKLEPPIQLDETTIRNAGIPLDDDPFAKAEGVKLLKPKEGKKHKPKGSKDSPATDGVSQEESAGEGEVQSIGDKDQEEEENINDRPKPSVIRAPPTPVTPEEYRKVRKQRLESPPEKPQLPEDITVREDRPPEPFCLSLFIAEPQLLSTLLSFLSFYDWCVLLSVTKAIRIQLVQTPQLREEILERFLKTVGYGRWAWPDQEPLSLSLQDLHDYMRGVSTPTHEYARVANLYNQSLLIHPNNRDPQLLQTVQSLTASTRAYTRVVLRLRAQAEREATAQSPRAGFHPRVNGYGSPARAIPSRASSRAPSPTQSSFSHSHNGHHPGSNPHLQQQLAAGTFRSPLFRLRRAPLLRVFVPSPEGDWLSDKSVLECEAECRRAGVVNLMRMGDVVWDVAVGDEGNVGRLVWDGSYLIDLDYTYSPTGDLPKYMPTLAFPPSYFHRVIRTGPAASNPIVHIDLSPWGEEIAANLQLLQDRVRTETPQGAVHNVVRWVHRSSFVIRPPSVRGTMRYPSQQQHQQQLARVIPIPDSDLTVDSGWYGTIVVETEGTNESLADLQMRCGPGAFPPRARRVGGPVPQAQVENRKVFRILREKSRPGEIWIRAVGVKERLL